MRNPCNYHLQGFLDEWVLLNYLFFSLPKRAVTL